MPPAGSPRYRPYASITPRIVSRGHDRRGLQTGGRLSANIKKEGNAAQEHESAATAQPSSMCCIRSMAICSANNPIITISVPTLTEMTMGSVQGRLMISL